MDSISAMATFTKEQVKHIGDLAAIALTDDEATSLESELNGLAESIDELSAIPTEGVEPTTNPVFLDAYLRPDVAVVPLDRDEALASAPATENGMFVAPRILGEE